MKKTCSLINELKGKAKKSLNPCFKIDCQLVEDKRQIANGFNNFFASIARNINAKLHSSKPIEKILCKLNSFLITFVNEYAIVCFFLNAAVRK